ncbi:MAG: T9SS type A sorting domain-containing protein [Rhodothermales bacterium]|nr:T9SS type A sorting domain-containing protein [Rhodothermales bacterium]
MASSSLSIQTAVGQSAALSQGSIHAEQYVPDVVHDASTVRYGTTNWGYNYDSLLVDLAIWQRSPFVELRQPGESVQGRSLWLVTVTDTVERQPPRFRVSMHARTHPSEVESLYTTREIIRILAGDSPLAQGLRSTCVFNIMPMYNPDGVELGFARQNANGVDLERGWDTPQPEPEVATLRKLFEEYMTSESPVRIALNMHADGSSRSRYFVYHHENGTSALYAAQERTFIRSVRHYWPQGILDWDGFISWTTQTPTVYPESWFWLNHGDAVLALTYEEIRTQNVTEFAVSAAALLNGISDYLGSIDPVAFGDPSMAASTVVLFQNYPNPFSMNTTISYTLPALADATVMVFDVLGRRVRVLASGTKPAGRYDVSFDAAGLPTGIYLYRLQAGDYVETRRMVVAR